MNPTEQGYKIIFKALNATFYGPGFVGLDILKKGLKAFIENHGGFDIIVDDFGASVWELVVGDKIDKKFLKSYSKYRHSYYPLEQFSLSFSIVKELREIKDIPIVYKNGFDTQTWTKQMQEAFISSNHYFLGIGEQFIKPLAQSPLMMQEKHAHMVNDYYYELVSAHSNRVISFYHTIDRAEFTYSPLENRKFDISVEGVLYKARKEMKTLLKTSNFKMPKRVHNPIYSALNKLGINAYSNLVSLRLFQYLFRAKLADSKISFTEGSGYKVAIRKFFEIPSQGALLLCIEPHGFKDMGFIEGEHFVELDQKDPIAQINQILKNLNDYQSLATKAQEHVLKAHSTDAMATYLAQSFKAIINGSFKGSFWKNGEFSLND